MFISMSDDAIKLVRFTEGHSPTKRVGILDEVKNEVIDINTPAKGDISEVFEWNDRFARLKVLAGGQHPRFKVDEVVLHAPISDSMPVKAAGVTYLRSKKARVEDAVAGKVSAAELSAYDRVYPKEVRPEIFHKADAGDSVGHGDEVGIRSDSKVNVPEPEMTLVFNSKADLVGYTIGNDMSSRDIEGENLLYLPQAKHYHRSSALGPYVVIRNDAKGVATDADLDELKKSTTIKMEIIRNGQAIDFGAHPMTTSFGLMQRSLSDLKEYLHRCQKFKSGVALMTGTGIVPPDGFTLQAGDKIKMTISGIGTLENTVKVV